MTITDYLTNPMGKGSAIVPNGQIKDKLNMEFGGLRYSIKCYQYLLADHWLIYHLKIPSTHQSNVAYDVVIEIDKNLADEKGLDRIDNLPFKVFSNCPSFMYTYAKVFYDKGLLINWMTDKYDEKITQKESTTRNTYGIISYERSVYLACRFIMSGYRNIIGNFIAHSIPFHTPEEIKKTVQSGKQVMKTYDKQKELQKKSQEIEKIEREAEKKKQHKDDKKKKDSLYAPEEETATISTTKKVKSISGTKGVKKAKSIKKVNRIKKIH